MASSAHTAASSAQEQLFNLSMAESTLFWTGLSFFVLLVVVWRYVAPVVSDILDQRSARIQEDMDKAASLREQAQQALAEYETRLKLAKKEAQEIVAHAKTEAERRAWEYAKEVDMNLVVINLFCFTLDINFLSEDITSSFLSLILPLLNFLQ